MNAQLEEILALPVRERITLAEDIWDNIAAVSEAVKLTEAQVDEIAQRLKDYRANPDECCPLGRSQRKAPPPRII
jgi:putative addiction module component (TIGR02574 family)